MAISRSGMASLALWGLAGLLILFLYASPVFYAGSTTTQHAPSRHRSRFPYQQDADVHVTIDPSLDSAPQVLSELSAELSASSFLAARDLHNSGLLAKRDALRCDNGPCIDGSCCSTNHICGYGPDYCGAGKCLSQCNATAMCGEYSENADMPCGMKLCCSAMGWCGTTAEYCGNADPVRGTLPCQAGYGSCAITGSPSCPAGGGSSNGRKVGYYQSWNVRERACNKVSPNQLNTTGYTHLFYSFASIDPVSYRVVPAHADDPAMMREFTALSGRGNGLQTWIAIGGFNFSDPGTATHTTWSDLCASKDRRTAFINSVREYMDQYGFQGVDLDWEYPGAPERGGRKLADTRNFAQLVREMRAAYGTAYGISLTLAPDYWYLRWFDAKAMEPHVDFFGFMAYDLHGSWDADVKTLGKKVRGQADIREISNNTIPLWFDGLNPAKINFGLAMYGRGYTLSDPSCNQLLCPFEAASNPAPCTNSPGVMSLQEIQQLINRRGLTPQYLPESMMKQLTWDDQWIGYDDEETFAAKKAWADSRCFGGTMVWSIDFQVAGSGGPDEEEPDYGEVVYIGSEVYQTPTAQCLPPCIMVFPPSTLPQGSSTTVTLDLYTATLEVGGSTTTVIATPPQRTITVTVIEYFNYYVTASQQPGQVMTLRPSFQAPPIPVVVTGPDGRTTTRTISPPPGGRGLSSSSDNPDETDAPGGILFPSTRTPEPTFRDVIPTGTFATVPLGTVLLPVPVPWPTGIIKPVIDPKSPVPDGGSRRPCRSWFFFICISWGDLNINFWDIVLPPGIIGPGPPPLSLFQFPTGWRLGCGTNQNCLPPWPRLTVGPDGQFVTVPPEPAGCEPTTAMLTIESTSYGTTTTQGTVRTTATQTLSREFPLVGCAVEDASTARTTTGCDAQPTPRAIAADAGAGTALKPIEKEESDLHVVARQNPPACNNVIKIDAVVFPTGHFANWDSLKLRLTQESSPNALNGRKLDSFNVIEAPAAGFRAFIYLTNVREDYLMDQLLGGFGLSDKYLRVDATVPPPSWTPKQRRSAEGDDKPLTLRKRASELFESWTGSHISVPPRVDWYDVKNGYLDTSSGTQLWKYQRHNSECQGQYVYIVEEDVDVSHPTFSILNYANRMENLTTQNYGNWRPFTRPDNVHGTQVASMVAGNKQGVCPQGKVTLIRFPTPGSAYKWGSSGHDLHGIAFSLTKLEMLVLALQDIVAKDRIGKAVINMSWGSSNDPIYMNCLKLVLQELDKRGAVLVAASGNSANSDVNTGPNIFSYPQLWADKELPNLVLVGATDSYSRAALFSARGNQAIVYAPGKQVPVAKPGGAVEPADGTSFAAPAVAGLIAYFRALPLDDLSRDQLRNPATVKKLVAKMVRAVQLGPKLQPIDGFVHPNGNLFGPVVMSVWNGQISDSVSCLVTPDAPNCPKIDLDDPRPVGDICWQNAHPNGKKRAILEGRQADSCPLMPPPGGPGNGGGQGPTKTVTYRSGTPSPTCRDNCGTLCTGYWCRPTQTGQPPHFTDPTNLPTGPIRPTNLPTLPPNPDWFPTSPEGGRCVSSATLTSIGGPGGGGGQATITSSGCMSWATGPLTNLPTLPPNPGWFPTSPLGGTCVSSATLTSIGGPGGGGGQATITSSGCISWKTPEPTPDPPPPTEPEYPYTWYIYATVQDNVVTGADKAEGYLIFDSPPSCNDVRNARTLADVGDVTGSGHRIRCPDCSVCMTCGNDWSSWWSINVLELHTPSTWVTWYADRNNALVDTKNVPGGRCEIDTTHNFECVLPLGPIWGSRQLKCHAVFSQASIFA